MIIASPSVRIFLRVLRAIRDILLILLRIRRMAGEGHNQSFGFEDPLGVSSPPNKQRNSSIINFDVRLREEHFVFVSGLNYKSSTDP